MSFTKFLDVAQEDNESISGAGSASGPDPGSHCFQEGEDVLGFPGAFLLGSQSCKGSCWVRGKLQRPGCQVGVARPVVGEEVALGVLAGSV